MTHPLFPRLRATALGATALCALVATAQADQVILDDLIVDGSLCVGQDCVSGESFGFDTLRLKENNLRIKAQDTSNSASFPTNDWQITFNDSSNGGQNKFSIDDIDGGRTPFTIEAGARANALYVDDGGRVGFGTSTPVVELHLKDGDSPALRLEQDGSSGFTAQTWDIAGNETNFFVRDVTNGSNLPFKIRPNAPSNAIYIDTDGDIGMGSASPEAALHVVDDSANVNLVTFEGPGVKLSNLISTDGGAAQYRMITDSTNRRFVGLNNAGQVKSQMIFADNSVQIAGPTTSGADLWAVIDATGITTQGPTCDPGPCDRTFDPEHFQVPSIEEHAAFMWENRYLWGVGPTSPDKPYNVTEKTAGMLHELEVAHIYIEQLHDRIEGQDRDNAQLLARIEALEAAARP